MDTDTLDLSYTEQSLIQIGRLKETLLSQYSEASKPDAHLLYRQNPYSYMPSSERLLLDRKLLQALISLGGHIDANKSVPVVDRSRASNYYYDKDGVIRLKGKDVIKYSICSTAKSCLMLDVVAKIIDLHQNNGTMTSRELFYTEQGMCKFKPKALNTVIEELCCLLGCSRVHLRILSQSKGIIFGDMKFKLKSGKLFDCMASKDGLIIPNSEVPIVEVTSNANFVIIIEKDSVLQKILCQEKRTKFIEEYKPIIFTARGYPDINSRAFLNFIWTKLKIPFFVLTDADPHGIEIACCYKFGCYSAASEASYLANPHIKWLGLLPSDVKNHRLPEHKLVELSRNDRSKLESLSNRPYLRDRADWLYQIELLQEIQVKAELESIDIEDDYLTQTYLPNKLRYASWLDS